MRMIFIDDDDCDENVGECKSDSLSQDKGRCQQSFPPHCKESAVCWGFFVKVLWNRFFFWRVGHFYPKARIRPSTHCTEAGPFAEVMKFCALFNKICSGWGGRGFLCRVDLFLSISSRREVDKASGIKSWILDGNLHGVNANVNVSLSLLTHFFITFSIMIVMNIWKGFGKNAGNCDKNYCWCFASKVL